MKRIFGGLVLLTILGLAACDTIPSDAILNAEALAQTNEISLADVDGTDEPLAVVVGHTYDITFWPDPNIAQDIEAEWDFGVSYEFDHSEDSTVRFLAFGMYEDEPEASANRDVCETTQSIPSAYPERPFWSTGTPTEYPAGRHRFEQSYHYPGGEEMAGINHIVVWLIHQQGSITGCHVRQYIVSAQTNYGDVNGDGEVNITDALMVARYYQGLDAPGFNADVADVNEDGVINMIDAVLIINYYTGQISELPAQITEIGRPATASTCGQGCGDVNADGKIDTLDALMTGQYASWTNPAGFNSDLADVNEDGLIDTTDVDLIMKHYVGLVPALPARPEPPAPMLGDVNGDGEVNITDALMVARYYQGLDAPGFNADVADVNEDGLINMIDAVLIINYYTGQISELPAQITEIGRPATASTCGQGCGDINADGKIDTLDALMTGQYASWTNPAGFNSDLADVNEDGLIDMTDVDLIMKHYVGLVPALPARPEPPAPTCGEGCGDVNGDGKVNTTDALLVTRYYQGLDVPGFNASVADVNEDGAIDGTDATFIMQYYAGLIDALPWHGSPAE